MSRTLLRPALAALGAGSLVTAAALVAVLPSASAAPVSASPSYACTSSLGDQTVTGTISLDLEPSVVTGATVPSRVATIAFTIPDSTMDTARAFGATSLSGTAKNLKARFGAMDIPVADASIPATPIPADGAMTVQTTATISSFVAPAPGQYVVKVPASVTVEAVAQTGLGAIPVTLACTVVAGPSEVLGTVTVTGTNVPDVKAASTVTAKLLNKPATTKKRAKIAVTVTATGVVPTGTVTAKLGTKTLATKPLTGGKATLKLAKLKKGKRKIVIRYSGDAKVLPGSKTITLRVKAS